MPWFAAIPAVAAIGASTAGAAATATAGTVAGLSAASWGAIAASAGALSATVGGIQSNQYNAGVAETQAKQAKINARVKESDYRYQARREVARGEAIAAASGVDPGSGTPMDIMMESAYNAELNARRIRMGGQIESSGYKAEARGYRNRNWATAGAGFTQGAGILTNWWST